MKDPVLKCSCEWTVSYGSSYTIIQYAMSDGLHNSFKGGGVGGKVDDEVESENSYNRRYKWL